MANREKAKKEIKTFKFNKDWNVFIGNSCRNSNKNTDKNLPLPKYAEESVSGVLFAFPKEAMGDKKRYSSCTKPKTNAHLIAKKKLIKRINKEIANLWLFRSLFFIVKFIFL